jgi:hypothetical protein
MSLNENEQFKKLVKKFNDTLGSLNIKSSDEMVSEHREMIRAQSLIQGIEKKRDALLNEVNDYEIECKDNINKEKAHFEEIIK